MWTNRRRLANRRIARCRGRPEPTKPRGGRAEKGKIGDKVKKDRVDQVKAKPRHG